jgi:hypothetical protein
MPQQQPAFAVDEQAPRLTPALLLNASLSAAQALPRMLASDAQHLALRRTEGLVVFWYVMDMAWALGRVQAAPPDEPLKRVLDVHEHTAAPARAADSQALQGPLTHDAVVLDGDLFVGVQLVSSLPQHRPELEREPEQQQQQQQRQQTEFEPPFQPQQRQDRQQTEFDAPRQQQVRRMGVGTQDFQSPQFRRGTFGAGQPERLGLPGARDDFHVDIEAMLPAAAPVAAEPFSAFPRLDAPDGVDAGQAFTVTVGLASMRQPGVMGGPVLIALPTEAQTFVLDVQLCVDGFIAPKGLQAQLTVARAHPGAQTVSFDLIAPSLAADEDARLSSLRVLYFHEGQVCGTAVRRIAVTAPGRAMMNAAQGNGRLWTQPDATPAAALNVVPGLPQVDLTVVIDKPDADPSQGRFVWSFRSELTADLPKLPVPCNLGSGSAELGGKIIAEVQNAELLNMADGLAQGLGATIRDAAPPELWVALAAVRKALLAAGQDRPLNVLLLTAEPHVPWELALLEDDEKLLPDAPPYLGCQVNLGRWPLGHAELPPRASVLVQHMAAVVGDYAARSGWRQLDQAVEEGQQLVQRYQAVKLSADAPQIKQLLMARLGGGQSGQTDQSHGAEAVHFACHGEATQNHVLDAAVILAEGARLSPLYFARTALGKQCAPFLFMNACQVGKAGELLASFSGFAGECLKGGFRGFLAPLWSVEDAMARDIALSFYDQAFGDATRGPRPLSAVLREMRARFRDDEPHSLTRLAYVFYGHPGLTLTRQTTPQANSPVTSQEPQP